MSPLKRLLNALTPKSLGTGPSLLLYAIIGSAILSIALLNTVSRQFADLGQLYAWYIGANCFAFILFSFWAAVRTRKKGTSFGQRVLVWAESIPLAVALITSLAYASMAGSIYSSVEPAYGKAYIFHSMWYLGLIVMLAVNLVLCSFDSSAQVFKLPGRRDFRDADGFYANARNSLKITASGGAEAARDAFRRVYRRPVFEGNTAYVQRGIFARFGPTVVHIGLMIAFAAGGYRILSERIGFHYINTVPEGEAIPSEQIRWMGLFDSQIQIAEGQSTSRIMVKKNRMTPFSLANSREVMLDFEVKAHNFEADMYPGTETPRYFGSLLEITDKTTGDKKIATVDMNTAVEFNGYKFSQNSYSMLPQIPRATVEVTHVASGDRFRIDVGPGARNKLAPKGPAARYQVELDGFSPGDKWRLYDEEQSVFVPIADGELEGTGEAAMTLRPVAFYRDFKMGDLSEPPFDASEDLNNPALNILFETKDDLPQSMFLFLAPGMGSIGGPEHLAVRLVDVRESAGESAMAFRQTGDVPPLVPPGAAVEGSGIEELPTAKLNDLRDQFYPTTSQYEYRVTVADRATGTVFVDTWASVDRKVALPEAALGLAHHEMPGDHDHDGDGIPDHPVTQHPRADNPTMHEAALAEAKARGDQYMVRYIEPTEGFRTILGVIRDPSLPYLYFGCIVVIFGVLQSFGQTYREVWMHIEPANEKSGDDGPVTVRVAMKLRGSGQKPFEELERLRSLLEDAPPAAENATEPSAAAAKPAKSRKQ